MSKTLCVELDCIEDGLVGLRDLCTEKGVEFLVLDDPSPNGDPMVRITGTPCLVKLTLLWAGYEEGEYTVIADLEPHRRG